MAFIPMIPGDGILNKLLLGVLVVVFGAFFVTVSSRIVGIIGSSNNPVSGMTIATVMATCLVFIGIGWSGKTYEPMVLVVGGMICIAAANAGATSQDLKTGYIVGATPKYQQIALFIGVIVSSIVIGLTVKILDTPTIEMAKQGIQHAIGSDKFPAPQATLMATLIKGILSFNLDWQFVFVGVALSVTMELCGINSLSFAVGAYLPLSTTLPIFAGSAVRGLVDWKKTKKHEIINNSFQIITIRNHCFLKSQMNIFPYKFQIYELKIDTYSILVMFFSHYDFIFNRIGRPTIHEIMTSFITRCAPFVTGCYDDFTYDIKSGLMCC